MGRMKDLQIAACEAWEQKGQKWKIAFESEERHELTHFQAFAWGYELGVGDTLEKLSKVESELREIKEKIRDRLARTTGETLEDVEPDLLEIIGMLEC